MTCWELDWALSHEKAGAKRKTKRIRRVKCTLRNTDATLISWAPSPWPSPGGREDKCNLSAGRGNKSLQRIFHDLEISPLNFLGAAVGAGVIDVVAFIGFAGLDHFLKLHFRFAFDRA